MKRFTFMLMAAFIAVCAFAQSSLTKAERATLLPFQGKQKTALNLKKQGPVSAANAPRRIKGDPDAIITSVPSTAQVKVYERSGKYYAYSSNTKTYTLTEQSGNVKIAFDGNDVYIQNIIADDPEGTWVKGTLEGNTITVPLGQFTWYSSSEGYGLYITMASVDASTFEGENDTEATEVTYTIDGDKISLNGTSATATLTVAWSDDDTVYLYGAPGGEFETVFTEMGDYVAPELVELPDGVEPEVYTLTAAGYASANSGWQSLSIEEEVQVAFDGNDVYVSGLAYWFPEGFVKGTLANGQVTFPSGQLVGEDEYGPEYLVGFSISSEGYGILEDAFVFDFDDESGTLTLVEGSYIGESAEQNDVQLYTYLEEATFTPGAIELPDPVVLPDGAEVETWYISGTSYDGAVRGTEVGVAKVGNDFYLQGLCPYLPEAVVKGTLSGNTVTFATGQYYGQYEGQYNLFFAGFDNTAGEMVDVEFTYDAEAGTLTSAQDIYILLSGSATQLSFYDYYVNIVISKEEPEPLVAVEAPADLQTDVYQLKAFDSYYEEEVSRQVSVGFYGTNEVYFQGLSEYVADAWVKGTIDANGKVTIPETYLGVYESIFGDYEISFSEAEFIYDAEAEEFTSEAGFITQSPEGYAFDELEDVVLTKITEVAGTPADPSVYAFELIDPETLEYETYPNVEFEIPTVDTNGAPMLETKLSYVIWIVNANDVEQQLTLTTDLYTELAEDMTEIPYTFSDDWDIYAGGYVYLNQDPEEIASWKKIGVQSIYRGGGEEHKSNIGWFDIASYIATGIQAIDTEKSNVRYFDLQGRAASSQQKGLVIMQFTNDKGQVKTAKVLRK